MKITTLLRARVFRLLSAMLLGCVVCFSVCAQTAKPITREGLEKALKIGGLKPAELVTQITRRGVDFVLTPQLSAELSDLGAAPEVVQAVGANYRGVSGSFQGGWDSKTTVHGAVPSGGGTLHPVPVPVRSIYPAAPGVYVREGGTWTELHQESAGWHKEGFLKGLKKVSGGLIDAEVTGQVAGAHSATAFHSPAVLLIRPDPGLTVDDYIVVHMHAKRDNREFKASVEQLHSNDQVAILPTKVENNLFQVVFAQGSGDYAVLSSRSAPHGVDDAHGSFLFTFEVLP